MIAYVQDSLFASPAQALVNTVNTVGIMGKGLAKSFKALYPEMFVEYRRRCEQGELTVGQLHLYRTRHKWILNFPTKRHWRQTSRVEDIADGLRRFCEDYATEGITSIAFPQLGCGHGGLDWESVVRPVMEHYLERLPIDVFIHVSGNPTDHLHDEEWQLLADWLTGSPRVRAFAEVVADLAAIVSTGDLDGWCLGAASDELCLHLPGLLLTLRREDLFDLWRRFRVYGYLSPRDIEELTTLPADPVLSLLASLPYVARSRIAETESGVYAKSRSTRALLDTPDAWGVRIVPARYAESSAFASLSDNSEASCDGNQTTRQLALFSRS